MKTNVNSLILKGPKKKKISKLSDAKELDIANLFIFGKYQDKPIVWKR